MTRIKDISTTATEAASDDYVPLDGTTNDSRKILANNLTGLRLLEEQAASSSASLDFASSISSTFDEYQIEILNLIPATNNAQLYMRMSTDGGSSYDSGTNYGSSQFVANRFGSSASGADSGVAQIRIDQNGISNTATYGFCGTIKLFSPASTSLHKIATGTFTYLNTTYAQSGSFAGRYLSTTAVDAFQFLMSSGNIASGTIRVYGLAK